VAARGEGHSGFGQSQVRAGVVIDMGKLARVHDVARRAHARRRRRRSDVARPAGPDACARRRTADADRLQMVTDNHRLLQRVRRIGGHDYPVGATPATRRDWQQHFGAQWPRFARARRRYDPAEILTPGTASSLADDKRAITLPAVVLRTRQAADRPRRRCKGALAHLQPSNGAAERRQAALHPRCWTSAGNVS
jgi:hypothetical protein